MIWSNQNDLVESKWSCRTKMILSNQNDLIEYSYKMLISTILSQWSSRRWGCSIFMGHVPSFASARSNRSTCITRVSYRAQSQNQSLTESRSGWSRFADSRLERKRENGGGGEEGRKGGGRARRATDRRAARLSQSILRRRGVSVALHVTRVKYSWNVNDAYRSSPASRCPCALMHLTARLAVLSSHHQL